jgi:hypothetical protein
MERDTLESLAANPHYKMTSQQLEDLARLRAQDNVQHSQNVPRHDVSFQRHDPTLRKEGDDERAN